MSPTKSDTKIRKYKIEKRNKENIKKTTTENRNPKTENRKTKIKK